MPHSDRKRPLGHAYRGPKLLLSTQSKSIGLWCTLIALIVSLLILLSLRGHFAHELPVSGGPATNRKPSAGWHKFFSNNHNRLAASSHFTSKPPLANATTIGSQVQSNTAPSAESNQIGGSSDPAPHASFKLSGGSNERDNDEQPIVINSVHSGAQQPYIASKGARPPTSPSSSTATPAMAGPLVALKTTTRRPSSAVVSHRTAGVSATPTTTPIDSSSASSSQPSQEFERQQVYATTPGARHNSATVTTRTSSNATTTPNQTSASVNGNSKSHRLQLSQSNLSKHTVDKAAPDSGAQNAPHSVAASGVGQHLTGIIRDFGHTDSISNELDATSSSSLPSTVPPQTTTTTTAGALWMQSVRDNHVGPLRSRLGLVLKSSGEKVS